MSKKRLTKLNKKVKTIFNGLGFDEGIKYLSVDILMEIAMAIGLKDVELNQKYLLKEIRKAWSSTDLNIRSEIINYLQSIDFQLGSYTNEEKSRKEIINEILSEIEMTQEERKELFYSLEGTKTKSIDYQLVENKLKAIRENIKICEIFKDYSVDIVANNIFLTKMYTYKIRDDYYPYNVVLHLFKENLQELDIDFDIEVEFDKQNYKAIKDYESSKERLLNSIYKEFREYGVTIEYIVELIDDRAIFDISESLTLELSSKAHKRITKKLNKEVADIKTQKLREELLARSIRDFKNLFPMAREMKRELIFYTGPTNSGKTYQAMQHLVKADTGFYLAPLRLLALEGYEYLRENGIESSLITGEEQIVDDEAWHISSTIEMLNFNVDVDVCVIDEVQMINDRDRGWAWTNAIIGVAAKKVIMTGSKDTLNAIKQIAQYLGEELTIKEFKRKNELELLPRSIDLDHIPPKSAIVAFSRKDVLYLKQQLSSKYKVSVVYGNLSPEVRREEAKRFRTNQTDVLVSTDAIAMGLNLPIKTVIFAKDSKFDGESRRKLTPSEILQISGRAGRFGHHEKGYVGGLNPRVHSTIKERFFTQLEDIHPPFSVMASLEHIELISRILNTKKLAYILDFFGNNMEFDGPFIAKNIESMLELAKLVDEYNIDLRTKFFLSCAPMSLSSPYLTRVYLSYASMLEKNQPIEYYPIKSLPSFAHSSEELLKVEDMVKEISLYLWLSFKFDNFLDVQKAKETRDTLNKFIENSLKHSEFTRRCVNCGANIPFRLRHEICDRCHRKLMKRKRR
jgi:ATP-dependent RNA helicase SUPV3L1/SUV3